MVPDNVLDVGQKYSKRNLSDLLDQPNLSKVREGVYNCTNSNSNLLFALYADVAVFAELFDTHCY